MLSFSVFAFTFLLIALAEFGDKTQFVVIAVAMRTRRMGLVAAGVTLGITLVIIFGVSIGTFLDVFIPMEYVSLGGAIAFLALGLISLIQTVRHSGQEDQGISDSGKEIGRKGKSIFLGSAAGIGLMEFGDKTQVATITLAATYDSPFSVALGAILAEATLMAVGAFVGCKLLARLRKDVVDYFSSALFIIVGLWMILLL